MKFGARIFESTKIILAKKWVPLSLIKIGPVTAEILVIWTIVTRIYVAWANFVTIIVGI